MIKEFNDCIGCYPDMPCIGLGCPQRNQHVHVCDNCGSEDCDYILTDFDGDFCMDCFDQLLNSMFNETDDKGVILNSILLPEDTPEYYDAIWETLAISEKADLLDIDYQYN